MPVSKRNPSVYAGNINYTYRCYPTEEQEHWLRETANQCRRWWNDLVGRQRQAHRQIVSGHEEHTRQTLASLLVSKKETGARAAKLNKFASELGNPEAAGEALRAFDAAQLEKTKGAGLEVAFAIAVVTDIRGRDTGRHLGAVFAQLVNRFRRTWQEVWRTAKVPDARRCGPPRFKTRRDPMPLTRQWQRDWDWIERNGKRYIDIGAFLPLRVHGHTELQVEVDRDLPGSARIKELKLKHLSARWELTLAIEVEDADYFQDQPVTGKICGIDPGCKTAATVANLDGTESRKLTPGKPLNRAIKRLEVLQRRFARQQRVNNPECCRPDGTWIKGRRARKISNRMRCTLRHIRSAHQKIADVRKTYWGQETARLVKDYDQIYVGDWTPPTPKSKGELKAAREAKYRERQEQRKRGAAANDHGRNKSDTDNPLGDFRRQLAERVARSAAPEKKLVIVRERLTTRMCSGCGEFTGPMEQEGLVIRRWTCIACGKDQDRDIASAINIARRGMETDALLVSVGTLTPQKARISKARREPSCPRNDSKVSGNRASAQMAQQKQGPLASDQLVRNQEVGVGGPHAASGKPRAQPSSLVKVPGSPNPDTS